MTTLSLIKHLSPCSDGAAWLQSQPNPESAWNTCHRADWMLWLLSELRVDWPCLRDFARWCALSVLDHWPDPPDVVLDWLMTGDESIRREARAAASAAAAPAGAASYAASYAAAPAAAASYAASYAADRAAYAAYAAAAADHAARKEQADELRRYVSWPMVKSALRKARQ